MEGSFSLGTGDAYLSAAASERGTRVGAMLLQEAVNHLAEYRFDILASIYTSGAAKRAAKLSAKLASEASKGAIVVATSGAPKARAHADAHISAKMVTGVTQQAPKLPKVFANSNALMKLTPRVA